MQNTKLRNESKKRISQLCFFVFLAILFVVIIFINTAGCAQITRSVPSLDELNPSDSAETSKVYAIDGTLVTEFHAEENREIVPFGKMSGYIKDAILAVT